ncbi:MAG: TRAP transporter large permease [Sphaerochaetaceae bacterium]|nr:TRAP transporter large permease [Sphaerochaetaceae bacterium]
MAIILIGVFFLAMLINIPIAFCLGLGVFVAMTVTTGLPTSVIPLKMNSMLNNFSLLAIPLYILAGQIMNRSGISAKLLALAKALVGRIHGGIAMSNVLGSLFFGGISGSSLADVSSIGAMIIPEMKKDGYDVNFTGALTAATATLSGIIPPSISFVLYGTIAGTSIAALFMAGIIPGLLLATVQIIYCYGNARFHHLPKTGMVSGREFWVIVKQGLIPMGMPIIIVGGIYGGVFTATEAGAVSVLYALIAGIFIYKNIGIKEMYEALIETAIIAAIPTLIISFSGGFAFLSSYADLPLKFSQFISSLTTNRTMILILINVMLLIIGMFMDGAAVYPIVVPIFLPILISMGVSPVQFGVMIVFNLSIGLLTPPVGGVLYAACAVGDLNPTKVAKKMIPFILIAIGILMLITYVPWVSEYVPSLLRK